MYSESPFLPKHIYLQAIKRAARTSLLNKTIRAGLQKWQEFSAKRVGDQCDILPASNNQTEQ